MSLHAVVRGFLIARGDVTAWIRLRPEWSIERIALVAGLFFAIFTNTKFFREVAAIGALQSWDGWRMIGSLFVAIAALNMLLLCMLLNRWTVKPIMIGLLLVTAAATYYMDRYTVYFDSGMIRNILQTDRKEASELLTPSFAASIVIYGVLPSILVWRIRIRRRLLGRALWIRAACMLLAAAIAAAAILTSFQSISSLMRNHKEMRYLITPGNYLVALLQVVLDDCLSHDKTRILVGTDARAMTRPADAKPRLLVLIVGETVRAQNWGLNGYARQTTPELQRIGPINFSNVTACGSSTEVSLPCMFSPYGRADYDKDKIHRSDSLLHVLDRAGVETLWIDNQSGCKGVCAGLPFRDFKQDDDPEHCDGERCLDEVMLKALAVAARGRARDAVIVLHPLGNHGPSYFRRYPQRFRRYVPDCRTPELGRCSREAIVNAYDNAILYADDILSRVIRILDEDDSHDTAMIYVSDHGESLGEAGLYLHGVPYAIAPDTQLKVPMVMWLSPGFASRRGIDMTCMAERSANPASHDNLFHSVLGLMQISTKAYDRRRDLFVPCTVPTAHSSIQ